MTDPRSRHARRAGRAGRRGPRASLLFGALAGLAVAVCLAGAGLFGGSVLAGDDLSRDSLGGLPDGWTRTVSDVISYYAPATDAGTLTIILPPAIQTGSDLRAAFSDDVPALIEDMVGDIRPSGPLVPLPASAGVPPGLMMPLTVMTEDGVETRVEVTGYRMRAGTQVILMAAPNGMAETDPVLLTARARVEAWRAGGVIVTPDLRLKLSDDAADGQPGDDAGDTAAAADPAATPSTDPDAGVENVIHYLRFAFDGSHPAQTADPTSVTALLLTDGRVFENEARAPAAFDATARPLGSPGTGRWQRDGEGYALAFGDDTQGTAVAKAAKTFAAPASMMFAGHYVGAGGGATAELPDHLRFYDDGSLTRSASPDGGESARYAISGRSITMTGADGAAASYLFGFQGEGQAPDLLVIGNRIYERDE